MLVSETDPTPRTGAEPKVGALLAFPQHARHRGRFERAGHARAHGDDAPATLPDRAQSSGDHLIEIRANREIGVMQRAGEPGLDVEVRDAGDGPPDEIADLAVRKSGISRPGHVARTDREACADRIAVEIEAELCSRGTGIETQWYAGNLERGETDATNRCARGVDRDVMHVIEHAARGQLRAARRERGWTAVQRGIAREAGQSPGIPLRLRFERSGRGGSTPASILVEPTNASAARLPPLGNGVSP